MPIAHRVAGVWRVERLSIAGAGLAATVPIGVALVRGLRQGWYPVGDNAYFSLRARDVLTDHHPLLGTWTSASLSVGTDMNNPGPLLWDLLALPAKVAPVAGIAVATALLNILCIAVMGIVARRRGGTSRTVGVLAAAAALGWTLGSELVYDPWQPHALLFPFLLYLVLVWSLVEGDLRVLPVAVGVGSVLVQTHLTYAVLVPSLGVLGVAAVAAGAWRARRTVPEERPGRLPDLRRTAVLTAVVAAICWAQPILEQLTADEGNMARLAANGGGGDAPRLGLATATQMLAGTVAVPPAWARPSFVESFVQESYPTDGGIHLISIPDGSATVVALLLMALALAGGAWLAYRRFDRGTVSGIAVAAAAMGLAVITASTIPVGPAGFGPHQVRWLWPIGIMAALVVVLAWCGPRRWVTPALVSIAVVAGVANLATHRQPAGPSSDADAMPVMLAMASQLEDVEVEGPVLFTAADLSRLPSYGPYSTPMMLEMDRRGVGFVVDDPSQARQVGESRLHPERATERLVLLQGDQALDAPPGARRIGYVAGLDPVDRSDLDRRTEELREELEGERLALTERGRRLAGRGVLPGIASDGTVDAEVALGFRTLVVALEGGLLDADAPHVDAIRRHSRLQARWDATTLGAYLVPIDEPFPVLGR